MSLSEILEAVRVLPPQEKAQVKALLDKLSQEENETEKIIDERRLSLKGSVQSEHAVTAEEIHEARREMWRGYMDEDFDE
jgi:hypothetical protein